MRVAIANERVLPRFGVDRLLVLLGRHLVACGHTVTFFALRSEPHLLADIGEVVTLEIPPGLNMQGAEREAARQMRAHVSRTRPDALVSGGWPFFRTAREAPLHGAAGLFIDAGAVAQDGLGEPMLSIQRDLRRVRQQELPAIDRVLPISGFIRDSQTIPDRGRPEGVRTVLLGGDHMQQNVFHGDEGDTKGVRLLERMAGLRAAGVPLLLLLGRFEGEGYKNSAGAYEVLRRVRQAVPEAALLLLDAGADCRVPDDLAGAVVRLGQPDDATLQAVMQACALGLSLSHWEGFNLPLAELQWLDRPALAFNIGAHPEVIAHPWLLCDAAAEMADKAIRLLTKLAPAEVLAAVASSGGRHRWSDTMRAWEQEIADAADARRRVTPRIKATVEAPRTVLVDVTNAAVDAANSGVMRVTRTLCGHLQKDPRLKLAFARWEAGSRTYRLLDGGQRAALANYGGPFDRLSMFAETSGLGTEGLLDALGSRDGAATLFLPEVALDGGSWNRVAWARGRGMAVGTILYDLIPVDHPSFCAPGVVAAFPIYLDAMLQTERVWSISDYSMSRFGAYANRRGVSLPARSRVIWLPGQLGHHGRAVQPPGPAAPRRDGEEVRIVCVSTLEPRKNHMGLLAAWTRLRASRPDLPVRLTLVGNQYAGAPHVWQSVARMAEQDERLVWRGVLDDASVMAEMEAAAFTIYPSLVEGFGLPILESLWMGRPCIVHDSGVMAELAAPGGCLCVDMRDPAALAGAIERLATDAALRERLAEEARGRTIATWRDYAAELGTELAELRTGMNNDRRLSA
ncbi:MAG TPA: glycosyltransferase [Acetobacteraceae bacterium]